ncbi:MAG: PilZ domain-containing protein [Bacteriovoracaceae bacterium]|nr:PilZ domain-containing protein [Bacteriovoracaceae bacterium]
MKKKLGNARFKAVHPTTALETYESLCEQHTQIEVWQKGSTYHEDFICTSYDSNKKLLSMTAANEQSMLIKKQVSILFKLQYRQYLSTGILEYCSTTKTYSIKLGVGLFVYEQRDSFRMDASTVVVAQTYINKEYFDIADISLGGMSVKIGYKHKDYFTPKKILKEISISLDNQTFNIHEAQVIRVRKKIDCEVVGIKFMELPSDLESLLFRNINDALFKALKPSRDY